MKATYLRLLLGLEWQQIHIGTQKLKSEFATRDDTSHGLKLIERESFMRAIWGCWNLSGIAWRNVVPMAIDFIWLNF